MHTRFLIVALALSSVVPLAGGSKGESAQPQTRPFEAAARQDFVLDPAASSFTVHVGKSGLFSFAGHEHLVGIREFEGSVEWTPAAPARSGVEVRVRAAGIRVLDPEADEEDRKQVQADMEREVLEVEKYPEIDFRSTEVRDLHEALEGYEAVVAGDLTLHGATHKIEIPVSFRFGEEGLRARGTFALKHSDFGLKRASAVGGTVKVKDRLELTFDVLARSNAPEAPAGDEPTP